MKRNSILVTCLLILALTLTACGGGQSDPAEAAGMPENTEAEEAAEESPAADPFALEVSPEQDGAPQLVLNETYYGSYQEGEGWVCFTTGSKVGAEYTVTLENVTPGSKSLYGHLYDEEGTLLEPDAINYVRAQGNLVSPGSIVQGSPDGRVATGTIGNLQPDTTYYLCLQGSSEFPADYLLTVGSADAPVPEHSAGSTEADLLTAVDRVTPGVSQSAAIRVPLGTKVFGTVSSSCQWLSFTTGPEQNAAYCITGVNETCGIKPLYGHLYDRQGTLIEPVSINYERAQGNSVSPQSVLQGNESGRAATGSIDTLEPNTTYYICLQAESTADYSLLVTAPQNRERSRLISSNVTEAAGAVSEEGPLTTGTNQNAAAILKHNTWYYGTFEEGYLWVSFLTGSEESEYSVTLANLTPDSHSLYGHLYDEYGTLVVPDIIYYERAQGNSISPNSIVQGSPDGSEAVGSVLSLKADTMYYICLQADRPCEYKILIGTVEDDPIEDAEETVFEVPFELNETQVRFMADEAAFIDESAAKEALTPVAEVILAHPDHPILLAGTTATFGDQAACEKLSSARAEAVKNMLVSEFGVPAGQLKTVGLGYEKDPFERGSDIDANGSFVRTEAAKNRRVVVLDAESDIAKEILGD